MLALLISCCSPPTKAVQDVISVTESDGELRIDDQRYERGGILLAAEDFDGDGADELLQANQEQLFVAGGNGSRRPIWSGGPVIAAALAEATSQHGARLLVLVAPPQGATSLVQLRCAFASEASCQEEGRVEVPRANGIITGDVDEDGVMDVLLRGKDQILLLLGRMRGEDLVEWTSHQPYGEAKANVDIGSLRALGRFVIADIDADGHLDVVTVDQFAGILVFFGDGLGSWDESVLLPAHDLRFFFHLYVVSSESGALDIVGDAEGQPLLFENSGARTFEMSAPIPYGEQPGDPWVFVGSFQSDADEMLLLDVERSARLATQTQDAWDVRELPLPVVEYDRLVDEGIVADLDGDGRDEIVLVSRQYDDEAGC